MLDCSSNNHSKIDFIKGEDPQFNEGVVPFCGSLSTPPRQADKLLISQYDWPKLVLF
jgi:hypothetical protein